MPLLLDEPEDLLDFPLPLLAVDRDDELPCLAVAERRFTEVPDDEEPDLAVLRRVERYVPEEERDLVVLRYELLSVLIRRLASILEFPELFSPLRIAERVVLLLRLLTRYSDFVPVGELIAR